MTAYPHRLRQLCALGALLLTSAALRVDARVIADGNPPLTDDMVTRTAGVIEHLLDVRLTPTQMQEYERLLAKDWQDPKERQGTLDMLKNAPQVLALQGSQRDKVRQAVVSQLRANTGDADNRWLLAIHDAAHAAGAPTGVTEAASAPTGPAPNAGQLLGKWRSGSISGVQYHNAYTGAPMPTNGSTFFLQFNEDGSYVSNGLMQITSYNCTTSLWSQETGRYRVAGDVVSLEPGKGTYDTKNNCSPSMNTHREKTLGNRAYQFRFENGSNGIQMITKSTTDANGKPDHWRREK